MLLPLYLAFSLLTNDASVAIFPRLHTNLVFIAVTALDAIGLETPYSGEITWTNICPSTNRCANSITLAWDEFDPSVIAYNIYWGTNSRSYQHMGRSTNTLYTLLFYTPLTNVITVSAFSNLWSGPGIGGPWSPVPSNSLTLTNPSDTRYFKGPGARIVRVRN